jgi:diguanylate cyclase (GGDEF)-like protein
MALIDTRSAVLREVRGRGEQPASGAKRRRPRPTDLEGRLEESFRDISSLASQLEAAKEELARASLFDPLTDCPNRVLFHDRLEQAVLQAKRRDVALPVLIMDVDRFKDINETLGFQAGDQLLRDVAQRLKGVLRESDTTARLGSDEFGVLLTTATTIDGAVSATKKIADKLAAPFTVAGHAVDLSMSIGVAAFPVHGEDAQTLLRHAEMAMTEARRTHSPFAVYARDQDEGALVSLRLASGLRRAIEKDELVLHFQPKVNVATKKIIGTEALVRWNHPELGLTMPNAFIPLAERTALITPLSLLVMRKALKQVRAWRKQGLDIPVAVNLSPRTLHQVDLPGKIARILKESDVPARSLVVEITESAIMIDVDRATDVVRRLSALGVSISIDDFGTGYSSLINLRRLPVSELKIDRSFVMEMMGSAEDAVIVRSIIDLGHNLGLKVVAEGVENLDVWNRLGAWGCDSGQGYFLAKPMPEALFGEWLAKSPWGIKPTVAARSRAVKASDRRPRRSSAR